MYSAWLEGLGGAATAHCGEPGRLWTAAETVVSQTRIYSTDGRGATTTRRWTRTAVGDLLGRRLSNRDLWTSGHSTLESVSNVGSQAQPRPTFSETLELRLSGLVVFFLFLNYVSLPWSLKTLYRERSGLIPCSAAFQLWAQVIYLLPWRFLSSREKLGGWLLPSGANVVSVFCLCFPSGCFFPFQLSFSSSLSTFSSLPLPFLSFSTSFLPACLMFLTYCERWLEFHYIIKKTKLLHVENSFQHTESQWGGCLATGKSRWTNRNGRLGRRCGDFRRWAVGCL